ncbi:cell wall-associated NlpC family hydrolase [Kibdelosporangium banguiense]|uniref:Cell wall-associated NlpC family hydrolase n=1 Tax=Kibdelosporangium banguiense TaxID=1365924 RepID=A0ABS4TGG7_9PSEU|nr:NlpC/P60 family protein [Kibdelosporangium banguiense]MBP2323519.1 cell wall-associated NlpC family hydrolase [Kibdelosporangium banguiense]
MDSLMSLAWIERRKHWSRATRVTALLVVVGLSVTATLYFGHGRSGPGAPALINAFAIQDAAVPAVSAYRYERLANPARTVVRDDAGVVVATLTDGAHTVVLTGHSRTFREPRTTLATVTSNVWVRLIAQEWREGEERAAWFRPWLDSALGDRSPDALGVAMEYLDGAPSGTNEKNVRFRGDASSGRAEVDDQTASVTADFYEYLGMRWTFPDGVRRKPAEGTYGAVDCSGFLRLVYGYRLGYPLLGSNTRGAGLPRSAHAMYELGSGVQVIPDDGERTQAYNLLQPGDLVFFDLDSDGGKQIDFAGIYLGMDSGHHHRFISSRPTADGPTFGDFGGASILDGGGHFSKVFRAAKRI